MSSDPANCYEQIFNQAAIGIARVAIDGAWLEVNDALCDIVGYSRRELLKTSCQEITHPDDREVCLHQMDCLLNGECSRYKMDKRYLRKGGEAVWVRLTVSLSRNRSNDPEYFVVIVEDISELRQARTKLAEQKELLQKIIDTAPMRIFWKDKQLHYLGCNPAFAQDAGKRDPSELIGKNDFDLNWHEDASRYREADQQVMQSGQPMLALEEPLTTQGGKVRWVRTSKVPLLNDDGEIYGVLGMYDDITEKYKAKSELLEKESLLREAQSIAQIGDWELDPATMYARWSDEIFRILDREPTDQAGPEYLSEILHPDDREQVISSLQKAITDGTKHHLEYRILRPSGEIRWLECQAIQKYDENNELLVLRGVIQDITTQKQYEKKIEESERHYRALFEQMPSAVAVYKAIDDGEDFVFQEFNHSAEEIEKIERSRLLGKRITDIFPGAPASGVPDLIRHVYRTGESEYTPELFYQDDRDPGSWREHWIYKLSDENVVCVYRDITERKRIELKLRTLSQAIEQSPVSVVITNPKGQIEYVNSTFESITGYTFNEVKGKNPRMLKSGKIAESVYRRLWQTISSGQAWSGEFQNKKKSGELFWEYAHIAPVMNDQGGIEHYVAVKEDITMRKQNEQQILHQAHFDNLTDLPNRFLAMDRLSQLLNEVKRSREKVAVLFIDLDDFKKINDSLGHEVGDKLLIEASRRLLTSVRAGDTVARLSGDEFIVLLSGLKRPEAAQVIVEKILENFRRVFEIDGRELLITASIGIAVHPDDSDTASDLLKNADSAMYHSKEQGRNTYSFFTERMNREVSKRLALEEQIHGALERREFFVNSQPQIDMKSGRIVGAEALLRWNNPVLGTIPPAEFIPIAEQTGLIIKLGEFVLWEALNATAAWQQEFYREFRIAVNISPRQFLKTTLFEDIRLLLQKSGVSPHQLELEITEGVLMSGHTYVDETLERITALGIHVAMDDFGTGYSSLSYLRSYPFRVLKIDQSFINDIGVDKADRELITAAISMAHGLNLTVIAEGVETEEQFEFLKMEGCDYVQGYLFSRPLDAAGVTQLLQRQKLEEGSNMTVPNQQKDKTS